MIKRMFSTWFTASGQPPTDDATTEPISPQGEDDVSSLADDLSNTDTSPVNISVLTINNKPLLAVLNSSDLGAAKQLVINKILANNSSAQVVHNGRATFISHSSGRVIYTLTSHNIQLIDRLAL